MRMELPTKVIRYILLRKTLFFIVKTPEDADDDGDGLLDDFEDDDGDGVSNEDDEDDDGDGFRDVDEKDEQEDEDEEDEL